MRGHMQSKAKLHKIPDSTSRKCCSFPHKDIITGRHEVKMRTWLQTFLVLPLALADVTCPYPKPCECDGRGVVCEYKGLRELPPPRNLSGVGREIHLHLKGNSISSIGEGDLPKGLVSLDLEFNPINSISTAALLGVSKTLRTIRFSNAQFRSLPKALEVLDNLDTLYISEVNIETYPSSVVDKLATSVTHLTLKDVGLTSWPEWLNKFTVLRTLDLSINPLATLPDNCFNTLSRELADLTLVNIGATNTNALQSLTVLRSLDLSHNQISDHALLSYNLVPSSNSLERMDISHNLLTQLPRLEGMNRLTDVVLSNNKIDKDNRGAFPDNLRNLDLGGNLFTEIPASVKTLQKLEHFYMDRNAIRRLRPHEFPTNSSLRTLFLHKNPIHAIDEFAFENVKQLNSLELGYTDLARLPLALTVLDKLEWLDMNSMEQLLCTCEEETVSTWINDSPDLEVSGQCSHVDIKEFVTYMARLCSS